MADQTAEVEMLRQSASHLINPCAARKSEVIRIALLRVRRAGSAYGTAIRDRGVMADALPTWLISSTWTDELPTEQEQRR